MAVQEKWSSRELERQFRLGAFEQAVLAPPRLSAALRELHGESATGFFKDAYSVEFLNLPADHSEADLHRGLLGQLRGFLGGTEPHPGMLLHQLRSFRSRWADAISRLDLLFFHRGLNCLVAVELKVDRFEPEHLRIAKTSTSESTDRDVRKPHENPAIGFAAVTRSRIARWLNTR